MNGSALLAEFRDLSQDTVEPYLWDDVFVLAKLNDAMVKILTKPEVIKQMAEQGAVAHPEKPAEFEAFIKAETAKWGPVVKQSGATVD